MIEKFILIAVVQLLGAASPGPDFVLIFKNSILHSRRYVMANISGISIGCLIHITYIIIGIELIENIASDLIQLIKYLGATYLIYLGITSFFPLTATHNFKSDQKNDPNNSSKKNHGITYAFIEGLLCNLLNPKVMVFFLSFYTPLIEANTTLTEKFGYALVSFITVFIWFSFLQRILTFEMIKKHLQQWQQVINKVLGVILIFLGINLLFYSKLI